MRLKTLLRLMILGVGVLLAPVSMRADGWLQFVNPGPTALVYERDPITLGLSLVPIGGGKVEFFYAPAGTTDFNLFHGVAGKSPVSFIVPGHFSGGTYLLTDIEPGATVSALIRGWTGSFASWEDAVNSGTAKLGVSSIFLVATTDPDPIPPAPPANIISSVPGQGFTGLILEAPEPGSAALLSLGAGLIVFLRSRSGYACRRR